MLLAACGKLNLDRSVKLSPEDKENIRKEYSNRDVTMKNLAKKYGVCAKTIKSTVDSEYNEKAKEMYKEYNEKMKELHREYIRKRKNLYKERHEEARR